MRSPNAFLVLHLTNFNCQLMLQNVWNEELQLAARVNITFNVNGPPEAEQIGAVIHQKNLTCRSTPVAEAAVVRTR